jgi:hypothetical protein
MSSSLAIRQRKVETDPKECDEETIVGKGGRMAETENSQMERKRHGNRKKKNLRQMK